MHDLRTEVLYYKIRLNKMRGKDSVILFYHPSTLVHVRLLTYFCTSSADLDLLTRLSPEFSVV